jgi:hypothetical protein
MALPIKANDTQEGCNPIASNCVIWQGPDIPCIKLCKGDTISDVTAKLAERLCTILEYLDVSAYDLSCFNPICPSPKDFQELIQLLVDRICAINDIVNPTNGGSSGGGTIGCPDCVVPVAQCLQRPDVLGNVVTTLQLKDYVILIGNEICTITTTVASLDSRVTSLESAVTDIQNNCCTSSGGGGSSLVMPASACLSTADGTPVVDYLIALDTAFCNLQTASGSTNDTNTALSYKCINGTDTLPGGTGTWNSIPGWIDSPTNLAQAVQDLWLIACEQNDTIITLNQDLEALQTVVSQCCGATKCTDTKLIANAFIQLSTPGDSYFIIAFDTMLSNIPNGFHVCPDVPVEVIIFPSNSVAPITPSQSIPYGNDFDEFHYPGPFRTLDLDGPYSSVVWALYVTITLNICVTNGTDTCTVSTIIPNLDTQGGTGIVSTMAPTLEAFGTAENPIVKATLYPDGFPYAFSITSVPTQWVMNLRLDNNNGPIIASNTVTNASLGSKIEFSFTDGLLPGQSYGMTVDIIQGSFSKLGIQAISNAVTPSEPTPAP